MLSLTPLWALPLLLQPYHSQTYILSGTQTPRPCNGDQPRRPRKQYVYSDVHLDRAFRSLRDRLPASLLMRTAYALREADDTTFSAPSSNTGTAQHLKSSIP